MKATIFFILSCSVSTLCGQGLSSIGASITVQNSASLTVQGDFENGLAGTVENSGLVQVSNDIINSSGNSMFVNNAPGLVELNGANQSILGVDSVSFYDLSLLGNLNSVKSLFVNIGVTNELDIDDQELQLNQNRATVSNPSLNAISFLSGFVSGDSLGGYLIRTTNQSAGYLYPVGAAGLSPAVRPILITPATTANNQFGVRLANISGNNDFTGVSNSGAVGPFDENSKQPEIGEINDLFYHNITHFQGADPADVQVLYSSFDGDFKTLSQWKSGQYINAGFVEGSASSFGLDKMMYKNGVIDFDHDVFALAELNTEIKVPGGISINDDGINDILVIEGLEYYSDNELQVFNRWGTLVFEAVDYQNNWDGTSDQAGVLVGDKLPTGTYFYILKLTEEKVLKGSLELKR